MSINTPVLSFQGCGRLTVNSPFFSYRHASLLNRQKHNVNQESGTVEREGLLVALKSFVRDKSGFCHKSMCLQKCSVWNEEATSQ